MKKFLYTALLLIGVTTLAGCASSIKDGPAEIGDTVYVDYVATYEQNDQLFNTTMTDAVTKYKASPKKEIYAPLAVVLGGENPELPAIVEQALEGMKAGDTKTVTVAPEQGYGDQYDPEKLEYVPYIVFEKSGSPTTKGTIRSRQGDFAMIKDVVGEGNNKKVVLDTNPLETYSTLNSEISVRQVGGKTYQAE